jgi:hypothetical protein
MGRGRNPQRKRRKRGRRKRGGEKGDGEKGDGFILAIDKESQKINPSPFLFTNTN